jgi:hypothetical protein
MKTIAPTKDSDERLANLLPVLQDFISSDNEEIDIDRDHAFLIGFISYANDDADDTTTVYSIVPSLLGKEVDNLEKAFKIGGMLSIIMQRTGSKLFELMESAVEAAKLSDKITKILKSELK